MKLVRKFTVAEHEEYGGIGLAPTWLNESQTDPLQGMGVAHDMLEHTARDVVEFQATGACYWLRGDGGYFHRRIGNNDPIENLAADFEQLSHLWHGETMPDPGRTTRLESYVEEDFAAIIQKGFKNVRENAAGWSSDPDTQKENEREAMEHHRDFFAQRDKILGWMRRGYRAAVKRWKAYGPHHMTEVFFAIEKAADEFLKREGAEYPGATVTITVDVDGARAWCAVVDGDDY